MKFKIIALTVVVSCVYGISVPQYEVHHEAEPIHKSPIIPILKQEFQQQKDGYSFSFETGNGIHQQETGVVKNFGDKNHETIVKQGSVTYHDEHGHPITLTYIADEHGFQPQGAHLPTPPPIPEEILKSLQLNAAHEQQIIPGQTEEHEYGQQYVQYQ